MLNVMENNFLSKISENSGLLMELKPAETISEVKLIARKHGFVVDSENLSFESLKNFIETIEAINKETNFSLTDKDLNQIYVIDAEDHFGFPQNFYTTGYQSNCDG